jgi:hypothetical protein
VDLRTALTLLGLQRLSLKAILENVLAGKPCLRNNGSHCGQAPVAASTLVMDNAVVMSARHMIRLSNPL